MRTSNVSHSLLLVDDDPVVREPMVRWFRDAGWKVNFAETCAHAVSLAAIGAPDFVVVEQRLPDGSGFDLLPRVRAYNPRVVGVVVTRIPSIAAAVHAIRNGFKDYLAKPMDAQRLASFLGASPEVETLAGKMPGAANDVDVSDLDGCRASLARIEWEHIHSVLLGCHGNVSEAARVLGLHRRSLQRKLRRNGPPSAALEREGQRAR
ncbi:MAG TPA: response regulator [Polyangia bacterium]|nr:response regulator [Polyangia bacterium]